MKNDRLENLAHLARCDREDEPREEREEAFTLRHAPYAEDREVIFPFGESKAVVENRQAARDGEGTPREVPELDRNLARPADDEIRAIYRDREEHPPDETPGERPRSDRHGHVDLGLPRPRDDTGASSRCRSRTLRLTYSTRNATVTNKVATAIAPTSHGEADQRPRARGLSGRSSRTVWLVWSIDGALTRGETPVGGFFAGSGRCLSRF